MKLSKLIVTIAVIGVVVAVLAVGLHLSFAERTLDFRGNVIQIEQVNGRTVYQIEYIGHTQFVMVGEKTKITREGEKTPLTAADIQVGDTIEGDYRFLTEIDEAKFIRIWQ